MLDAPALQDDFYLNLVDWSSQNVLSVGLGNCVYLWNACSSKVRCWQRFDLILVVQRFIVFFTVDCLQFLNSFRQHGFDGRLRSSVTWVWMTVFALWDGRSVAPTWLLARAKVKCR